MIDEPGDGREPPQGMTTADIRRAILIRLASLPVALGIMVTVYAGLTDLVGYPPPEGVVEVGSLCFLGLWVWYFWRCPVCNRSIDTRGQGLIPRHCPHCRTRLRD